LLRPGRFDKKVFVGAPPLAGRKAYLSKKLEGMEKLEEIERLAKETDGLSFGDLRELVTAVYALKEPVADVLARLKGKQQQLQRRSDSKSMSDKTTSESGNGGNVVPDQSPAKPKHKYSSAQINLPPHVCAAMKAMADSVAMEDKDAGDGDGGGDADGDNDAGDVTPHHVT